MRNEYPQTITPGLFTADPNIPDHPGVYAAPVRRGPNVVPMPNQIGPAFHEVSEFWLETPFHTNSDTGYRSAPAMDLPPADPHRRHFAPRVDATFLRWKLEGPKTQANTHLREALTLRIELFVRNDGQACWKKELTWAPGACPVNGRLSFHGILEDGATRAVDQDLHFNEVNTRNVVVNLTAAARFPDGVLTIDQSPFRIKLSIVPALHLKRRIPARWFYCDVLLHSLVVTWGTHNLMVQNRADINALNVARVMGFEQDILNNLQAGGPVGQGFAVPTAGQVHKLRLTSNLFPFHAADQPNLESYANHADFLAYQDLWGNGARVPILVQALIQRSAPNTHTDQVPEAVGRARLLWDYQEPNPNRWQDPLSGGAAPNTKPFLDHVHHQFDPAPQPQHEQNCPITFGGKQGAVPVTVFPDQAAPVDFPYTVTACATRPWASFSEFNHDRTGVVFQPARMAGDSYAITAYLDLDRTPGEPDTAPLAGVAPLKTATYEFLVQRKTKLYYLIRGGNPDIDADPGTLETYLKTLYERELHMVVDVVRAPVNNGQYINCLTAALHMTRPYINGAALAERHMVQALPWFVDYLIDRNPAANSPGIPFRTWAQFTHDVDNEFQNGVLREFDNVGNAGLVWGQRFAGQTSGATGILLTNAAPYLVLSTGGAMQTGENILTSTTNDLLAVGTAAKRSCPTVNFQVNPPPPVTATDFEKTVEVSVGGGAAHGVGFSRSGLHFRTGMAQTEQDDLKAHVLGAVGAHNDANPLQITITARQTTPRSLQRLQGVRTYLETLLTSGEVILVRDRVRDRLRSAGDAIGWQCLSEFGRRHQSALTLALLGDVIKRYADLNYAGVEGIFLMHLPGRFNGIVAPGENVAPLEPRVSGAFYGEATGVRQRAVGYLSSIPAAQALPLPTRNADSILCHEIGHAFFLPHMAGKAPTPHIEVHVGGDACIMNYELTSQHFCGFCMIRIRGWDWRAPAATLQQGKLIAVEIRDGAGVYTAGALRQYTNVTADAKWSDAARLDGQPVRIANTDRLGSTIRAKLTFSSGAVMRGYQLELLSHRDSVAYFPQEKQAHAEFNFERVRAENPAQPAPFPLRNGAVISGTTDGEGRVAPEDIDFVIPSPAVGDKYKVVAWDQNNNTVFSGEIETWRAIYYAILRGSAFSVASPALKTAVETEFARHFTDMIFAGEENSPTLQWADFEDRPGGARKLDAVTGGQCANLPGRAYSALDPMLARIGLCDQLLVGRQIVTLPSAPAAIGPGSPTVRVQIRNQLDVPNFDLRKGLWINQGPFPSMLNEPLDATMPLNTWFSWAKAILPDGTEYPIPWANIAPVQTDPANRVGFFSEVDVVVNTLAAAPAAVIRLTVCVVFRFVNGWARLNAKEADPTAPASEGMMLIPARRDFRTIAAGAQVNSVIHELGHALGMVANTAETHLLPHDNYYERNGNHCRFNLPRSANNMGDEYQIQANTDIAQCVMFGFVSINAPRTQFCVKCQNVMKKIDTVRGLW